MFTLLISEDPIEKELTKDKDYTLINSALKAINSKIVEININNIDFLIINCNDNKTLNKLKLLNVSKQNQNLQTYPNLTNFLQRNFLFGEEDL